jgi:TfoX/Sxy family transcriptional regulator of competence genes
MKRPPNESAASSVGRTSVVERKMMGGLCFLVDGAMCCSVSGRGGLLIRVGPEAQKQALREAHTTPMKMGRRTMSAFVRVAPAGYRLDPDLRKWIGRSLDFVSTLPKKSSPHGNTARGRTRS